MPSPAPPCPILYDQDGCLACNKPPALLTQAPAGIDSLETQLKQWISASEPSAESPYLGIVHRLDRPASGVLLFARDRPAAKKLSKQFEHRRVDKIYWAFVEGDVSPVEGTWTDYLYKIHGMAAAEVVSADHEGGKLAILHYRVLLSSEHGSWLEIELETGRTHQIRVQSASRGHPIIGDFQYGAKSALIPQVENPRENPIALHARMLSFKNPTTQELVELTADTPECWDKLNLPLELF